MLRDASVDRRFFQATADVLARRGVSLDEICARAGLTNPLDHPHERLPLALVSRVYEALTLHTGDASFIYVEPELSGHEQSSVLFSLIACCATPAEMVRIICRYSSIATDAVRFELHEEPGRLCVRIVPSAPSVSLPQRELAGWFFVQWARKLREAGIALELRVRFAHAPLFDEARYGELYGRPVRFGAPHNEVELSDELLQQPIAGHDERLAAYYRAQAERYEQATLAQGDLTTRIAHLIAPRLAFGLPDLREIALQLGVSARTLQRQLLAAGSSWSKLTDEARKAVALRELAQPNRATSEIAMLTGFGDSRAFLRAFRRWTGTSPGQHRRALLATD